MQRALKRAIKLGKTHFKLLLASAFLLFFIIPAGVAKASDFFINFEDCDIGNINTQSGNSCETFFLPSGYTKNPFVSEEFGNKFLTWDSSLAAATALPPATYSPAKRRFASMDIYFSTTNRYFEYNWRPETNWMAIRNIFYGSTTGYIQSIYIYSADGNFSFDLTPYNIPTGEFVKFVYEFDWDLEKFRFMFPDYMNWTDWYAFQSRSGTYSAEMQFIFSVAGMRIDNLYLSDESFLPPYSLWEWHYNLGLEITFPEVGSITEIAATTTTTGNWVVNENSNVFWDFIFAITKNLATQESKLFLEEINGVPGASGNFSINIEDLPDGNYQLCWAATATKPGEFWYKWIDFYCDDDNRTILRIGDYPDFPRYILLEDYEACEYEDCSEYSLLERLVCEFKNFGFSLICPEREKILDLKLTIDEIRNRFPVSYVEIARQEYNLLRNTIEDKTSFSFSLLGNKKEIQVNFFEEVEDDFGRPLTDYFRWFFTGLLSLAFILYGLNFIKRIF